MTRSRSPGAVSDSKARTSSGVGKRPAMSSVTRRRKVGLSVSALGGIPTCLSCLKTHSSTKFRTGGKWSTGAPSGMVARKVATLP